MIISFCLFLFLTLQDSTAQAVVISTAESFQSAVGFSLTPNGDAFVIDQKKNLLIQISEKGTTIKSLGGSGWGNYEFDNPTDVSSSFLLDVYVTDFNNRRIQRFDKNLNYIVTYDEQTLPDIGRFQPRACALSKQGDLFVVEVDGKRILKINKRNQLVREFGTYKDGAGMISDPKDIAVSQSDEVFVLDQSKIIKYDIFGNYIYTITLPEAEWQNIQVAERMLCATASDSIFILSFDSDTRTILTRSSFIGIPLEEQFVDASFLGNQLIVLTASSLLYCSPKH
jgi:hypothetical protein